MKKLLILVLVVLVFGCDSDQDKAGRFLLKGNEAMGKGEFNEAVRLYTEAIAKDPDFIDAYNNRGVANYRDGKYVEAINDYTHILLQIDPEFSSARRNRVNAYLDAGRYEKALEDLMVLKNVFPDSAFVDFSRGLVYHEMKDFSQSIDAFNAALKKDEKNPEILINAANGYFMLKDFKSAEALLNRAMAIDATEPNIYNTLALIETAKSNYDKALDLVQQALKLDITNPYFLNNRGYIYLMKSDLENAEPDIRRAIIGAPQNAWAYRNRGILLFKQQKYEGAIRNFELAEKLEKEVPMMHVYWAKALVAMERMVEACQLIKEASVNINSDQELKSLNCG